jgi:hypothetical protein
MARRHDRPIAVCTIAASLAALGAAVLPGPALADGSVDVPAASAAAVGDVVSATTAAALPLADPAQATPADAAAGAAAVVEQAPVPATGEPASEPAPTTTTEPVDSPVPGTEAAGAAPLPAPTEPTAVETDTAPNPAPQEASEPVADADTTVPTPDTATDTPPAEAAPPVAAPATPPTPPPATQSPPANTTPGAANINVSVRIASPGDNGAVSQVNVASLAPAPSTPPAATPRAEPSTTPASGTQTGNGSTENHVDTTDPNTWYWSWDCLGAEPIAAISPANSENGAFPTSWTWIWNCDGNGSQYQDQTPAGYQQNNTNISIRIGSPGDDGSVSQINRIVATQIAQARTQVDQVVSQTVSTIQTGLGSSWPVVSGHEPGLDPPVLLPVVSLPSLTQVLGDTLAAPFTGTGPTQADITLPEPPQSEIAPHTRAPAVSAGAAVTPQPAPVSLPAAAGARAADTWGETSTLASSRAGGVPTFAGIAGESVAASAGVSAKASSRDPGGAGDRDAPRRRAPVDDPVPSPISSVSAAAVGGGGSSGGGLPFLLALPFVAALLDLARRVALDRATWPSGHRRRDPDPPG